MPPTMRASLQNREMPSREDFRTFGTNLRNSAKEFGTVGAAARGLGGAFGSTMRVLATTTGAVGRGALGVGRGLLSTVGGMSGLAVMGGITAVTLGLQSKNRAAAENKADTEHSSTMSPTEIYDKYMESVGRAGQSTQNFASQLDQTTRTMVAGTTSMKQALTLSSADIGQATATKKSTVNDFGSSSSSGDVAAQVKLLMGSSNDPAAMQAIKLDLARQYSPDFVKSVLSQVSTTAPSYTGLNIKNPSVSTPKGASAGTDFDSIRQVVSGVTGMNIQGGPGGNKEAASDYYESNFSKLSDSFGFGSGKGSGLMSGKERISDKGRKQMDLLQQSISTQYANQQGVYGPDYAGQQQLQSINTAMDTAAHSGNEPAVNELGDRFARDLMGKDYKVPRITSSDITKHGGYVQALAAKDKGFASKLSGMKGISLTPGQGLQGNEVESARSQMISGAGVNPDMAGLFNNTLSTSVGKVGNGETKYQTLSNARSAMQSYMAQPSDTAKQISATEGSVTAMQAMGHSLADITEQASKTAASLGDVTDAGYQVSKAIIAEAAFRTQAKQPFQTSSQNISDRLDNAAALMKTPGTDDESKARRQQGKEDYATAEGDLATALKARISLYYQYNTSVKRAAEDYTKTSTRAEEDFQLSQTYAAQDYYLQREYQVEDYNKTVSRDYEDFRTTEARANRDFEITETRSQEDYLTTRQRAIRDFNKTLAREIEDQTKALYDPYHRIQTAAVWDATSLVSNMAEQNYAILKQAQQLKQLRKQGLTDQAIQQLDLTNPNNAQQLNQISGDISNNPKLLAQLNSQAKLRQGIGSMLVEDPSNKDIKRAREDFNTQLKDMEYDFNKSMSRSKSDFDRQMGDQVVDFDKSMVRMAVDFQTSLDRSDYQYGVSVARAQYEFDLTMARMEDDYQTSLTRMHDDLIFSTMEITGGVDDLWKTLQDTMKGQNDSANNVMKDGLNKTYDIIKNRKDDFRGVYKDLFPYDLSKLFAGGTGGPDQSIGGGSQGHAGHVGGPYAPYANAGAQAAMYNNVGSSGHNSFGEMVKGAAVSQGFGEHKAGSPGTGGGWPVPDPTITQKFGQNPQPSNPGGHPGIDLAVGNGTPIAAPLSGIVVYAGWNDGYGNCVIMDNGGGRSTLYGHQQAINVHVGDKLKPGDLIGWVDSTGASTVPHLHFETRQNGQLQDPAVDLPVWQATDGLGSFDPGATARGYGVHLDFAGLDPKKYEDMTKDAHLGPWGALLALYKAEVDAAKQIKESEASSLSDSSGVKLANNTQHLDEKAYAKSLFKSFGWGDDQFDALNELWEHESNWNPTIGNLAGSGAYGIPQALPASKMASEGADWATNPDTQIRWGLKYIASAYGSPSAAWAHWQARVPINGRDVGNWYGNGGIFNGPQRIGIGERGPEAVIPMNQMGVGVLAQAFGQAVTAAELSQMVQSGHAEKVVYHSETTTIDNSTHYEGDITVKADDPLTLKRQLEAAQRAKNLTRGRTPGRS
jgi:murein DD-endopeptidase MepM/ murein hydrolase activator NlpD